MEKKLFGFLSNMFLITGAILAALPVAAQGLGLGNQPAISDFSFEGKEFLAGSSVIGKASVTGGTIGKQVSISCEVREPADEGQGRLWARTAGEIFSLSGGAAEEKAVACDLPGVFPAQGNAVINLVLTNEKGYKFDEKDLAITLKGAKSPVVLSDGLWQLESWNPPSVDGKITIDLPLNHYVGHKPLVLFKAKNDLTSAVDVAAKAVVFKIDDRQAAVVQNSDPLALGLKETKDMSVTLPEIKEQGIYQGAIQLFDAKNQPVSNILDVRYIAKTKIGDPFMDILDASLDKSSYAAGDTARLSVAFEGSLTYTEGGTNADISAAIKKSGKVVAEAGGVQSLDDSGFQADIPISGDVADPSILVEARRNGILLSEYQLKEPAASPVKGNIPPFDAEEGKSAPTISNIILLAATVAVLALIAYFIWKNRKRKMLQMLAIAALFGIPSLFWAGPADAASIMSSNKISGFVWSSPVTSKVWKVGDSVNFSGSITMDYTAYSSGYDISTVRFYVSEDSDIPTYDCGGGRQCLSTGAGKKLYLMGSLGAAGRVGTYSWNQTYTIPSSADLSSGTRFWVEITGTYNRWHPDAMDASYWESKPMWMDAYQNFPPFNDAAYVSQSVPTTMNAGQSYAVSVTMQNTGTKIWSTSGNYNLGSQNPGDNTRWGTGRVSVGSTIASGSNKTFSFNVTAPSTAGTYNFQWRMVQDGVEWFGATTPNVSVSVKEVATIGGKITKETGAGISGVTMDLCGAGTATTNSSGTWSKTVDKGISYCVRMSSGLPSGYNYIHGTSNNSCHTDASTYEWQVAGVNQYSGCSYSDQRSWDLSSDSSMNFLVNYCMCGSWSSGSCGGGTCGLLQRQSTRTCTPANCLAQSQCADDSSCCICGAWTTDSACGAGGCSSSRQVHQKRTCNVAGCKSESQCVDDASCLTLSAALTASPTSGNAPLAVTLAATASGNTQGNLNYTFWWDCSSACSTVAACQTACGAYGQGVANITSATYSLSHSYAGGGNFTPKVVIEREGLSAEARTASAISVCGCNAWTGGSCGANGCGSLQREQTRTCTPLNCQSQSKCLDDATCCICSGWIDDDCAKAGCAANQMHQTQTCNVSGCQAESRCIASASCPRTLTVTFTALPASGPVPVNATLKAVLGGTAIGTINYTTWWDCNNSCATVADCQAACGDWDDKADGVTETTRTMAHTYSASGTFTPKVIVERHNLTVEKHATVTAINAPPTATTLTRQTDYCGSGLATRFSWVYSDPENDPQTYYQIQIDDNSDFSSPADDSGKVASATDSYAVVATKLEYDTTYYWRLKVWDDMGNNSGWISGSSFSTPLHTYPKVDFSLSPATPTVDEEVIFTDNTVTYGGSTIASRAWVLDGAVPATGTAAVITVKYATKDDYVAKLTVTDSSGYVCSKEQDLQVKKSVPDWEEL